MHKKKGLVILYDSNSYRQFLWYYSTYGKEIDWDALCMPNGGKGNYIERYASRAGIFHKLYRSDTEYLNMDILKKFLLFFKLFVYSVVGQQYKIASKILNTFVDDVEIYDEFISNTEVGFLSGLLAQFGKNKKVTYMEDGFWDFLPRSKWECTEKKFSFKWFQGLLMSRMGYCSAGRFYFEPTKYCYKISTDKNKMQYLNYREIISFDTKNTDVELYDELIKKSYPNINIEQIKMSDAVLFTESFDDFTANSKKYIKKIENYLSTTQGNILIKKHPRDMADYKGIDGKIFQEIDQAVPAEIILPYLYGKHLIFLCSCGVMLSIDDSRYDIDVLFFDDLCYEKRGNSVRAYYKDVNELADELKMVDCLNVNIVHL